MDPMGNKHDGRDSTEIKQVGIEGKWTQVLMCNYSKVFQIKTKNHSELVMACYRIIVHDCNIDWSRIKVGILSVSQVRIFDFFESILRTYMVLFQSKYLNDSLLKFSMFPGKKVPFIILMRICLSYPYHRCMVHLPTFGQFLWYM